MKSESFNNLFVHTLEELDFSWADTRMPEIVFLNNIPNDLHPKHYIALEFAEIFKADAVYFRYYDDNRYCVPQVYFYDNSITERTKVEIAEIHKQVYSSCQVPMICFVDKAEVSLFDCRIPVEYNGTTISNKKSIFKTVNHNNLQSLKTYFSAKILNIGMFWESDEASKHFLNNQSAYEKLVSVLSEIRKDFIIKFSNKGLSDSLAEDLLFKCILIKYLEENGQEFASDFYKRNHIKFNTLGEILENNQLVQLLNALESHFNGNVFIIENETEIQSIQNTNLSILAKCLDGKLDSNSQLSIWDIYSFKHIPIELISNFYEEFIEKNIDNKGTVYTPSFLVNLLIDECLPLSNKKEDQIYNLKIIDVSCGSGIFITSAFKRLVQRFRIRNGKLLPKENIKLKDIKSILCQNIYGVDKNKTAVKLSKFSLQLALCQILPNNELWNWSEEKVFDNLTENVFEQDYFDFITNQKFLTSSFDLIIGNPPFNKINASELLNLESKLAKSKIFIDSSINTKGQLALTFLESMMYLCKKDTGKVCQIIPSGELLYFQDSLNFRTSFFSKYNISQILDFTMLRRNLFTSKKKDTTVPVLAIFVENKAPNKDTITHITIRRTHKNKEKIYFELDYYDFFEVRKEVALQNKYCWKANLNGGTRVLRIIDKFYNEQHYNIKKYLKETDISFAKGKYSIRIKKSILQGTFPIIQEDNSESICLYSDNKKSLDNFLHNYLRNNDVQIVNNFFISSTSGRQGLRGAYTIIDSDIYNLPFVENIEVFSLAEKIIIDDVANYRISEYGLGEAAPLNQLISKNNTETTLLAFADIFNQSFNSIYKKGEKEQRLKKITVSNTSFAMEFSYGENINYEGVVENEEDIDTIIKNNISRNTVVNRVLRIYTENTITLIKPKNLRYWLKSIALRDADDVFDDMINAGY